VWRLQLTTRADISRVSWPFEHPGTGLGGDMSDDRVYFPLVGGVVEREGARVPYGWHGYRYPGESFAPIMISADATRASLVASIDPQHGSVFPMHARAQSLILHCPIQAGSNDCAPVPAGAQTEYQILYGTLTGDATHPPWFLAADRYRCWLRMTTPEPSFPPEMWAEEAFLGVGLQDLSDDLAAPGQADVSWFHDVRFAPWADRMGIGRVLFWGQMAAYHEGCCIERFGFDPRYDRELDGVVAQIKSAGRKVGFYTGVNNALGMSGPAGAAWLRDWRLATEARGANSVYVDELGRGSWGAEVATHLPRFSDGTIGPDALVEGYVDVYPRAALLSGALYFNAPSRRTVPTPLCPANPYPHPICDPACEDTCAFLPLVRAVMGNHVGYFGGANGGHLYMGGAHAYYVERQAFLIGLKLDLWVPDDSAGAWESVKALRTGVGWWAQRPVYKDRMLLSSVPAGVDARLHKASDGRCFVTVDNAARLVNATLLVNGFSYAIPAPPPSQAKAALGIITVPANRCPV
jgi:hypothetical protein